MENLSSPPPGARPDPALPPCFDVGRWAAEGDKSYKAEWYEKEEWPCAGSGHPYEIIAEIIRNKSPGP